MDSSSECDGENDIELLFARIKEQQELNKRLKDEGNELKQQREVLQEYKQEINYSTPGIIRNEMNIGNTLSSFSSIQFGCNNSITTQKSILTTERENEHHDVFFPVASRENPEHDSMSPCQGCGRMFKRCSTTYEKAFYIHCIKECPSYQNSNLIKKCDGCQKFFLNGTAIRRHVCVPIVPMYEGKQIALPIATINKTKGMFESIPCIGCGKLFKRFFNKGAVRNFKHYEKGYYIHCIRDCEEYKKLEFAQVCLGCDKWFLNQSVITRHKCHIQSKDRTSKEIDDGRLFNGNVVTKPQWMARNTFHRGLSGSTILTKPRMCPGCKRLIQDGNLRKHVISFKYLVHCIEECDEYKKLNLIRECNICELKFLNPISHAKHLTTHKKYKK